MTLTDLVVLKSNSFVEASYEMTLDEMRILSLTLGVFDTKNPQKGFNFTVSDFINAFPDVDSDSAYKQVQNAINKISKRWMTLKNDEKIKEEVAFVTKRTYFKKEGRFYIEFHGDLIPLISNLKKQYTKYNLDNICVFSSTYSIRMYELAVQYLTVGVREIPLNELKDWLRVNGKYNTYANFRRRVLEPAITEINDKSDIYLEIEQIKNGKKITGIQMKIKKKKETVKETVIDSEVHKTAQTTNPSTNFGKLPKKLQDTSGNVYIFIPDEDMYYLETNPSKKLPKGMAEQAFKNGSLQPAHRSKPVDDYGDGF